MTDLSSGRASIGARCDNCIARKVKCSGHGPATAPACNACARLELNCVFGTPKRRGRPLGIKTREKQVASNTSHGAIEESTVLEQEEDLAPRLFMLAATASEQQSTNPNLFSNGSASVFRLKVDYLQLLSPVNIGLCTAQQAQYLIDLYFDHLAGWNVVLSRPLHTLEFLQQKSTFLLTVICLISARHCSEIWAGSLVSSLTSHVDQVLWPEVVLKNYRSVQLCQSCMLLASFTPVPSNADDDPAWTLFGHAIRMAIEIGLNRQFKSTDGVDNMTAELIRDGQRCWLTCVLADRSWSAQTGRPPLIPESALTLAAVAWMDETNATLEDASIAALIDLRRILGRITATDHNQAQIRDQGLLAQQELDRWKLQWLRPKYAASYRLGLIGQIYYHYAHLLRLGPRMRMSDSSMVLAEAAGHAWELVSFASTELPYTAFQYGHNNLFTMMSYACVILKRSHTRKELHVDQARRLQTVLTLQNLARNLSLSSVDPPQKDGISQLHAQIVYANSNELIKLWDLALEQFSLPVQWTHPVTDFVSLQDDPWLSLFPMQESLNVTDGLWNLSTEGGNAESGTSVYQWLDI